MQCHRGRRVTKQACRNPLSPFGLRRHGPAQPLCCRSATMLWHRLCRVAWRLDPWREQRDRLDFYHGLLERDPAKDIRRIRPPTGARNQLGRP